MSLLLSRFYPQASAVLTSGNQNISGIKNFDSRPTVRGTGVLLQGEAAGGGGPVTLPSDILFTTGTQTVTGPKNFTARPTLSGLNLITTGDLVNLELNIEGALASSSAFNGNRQIKAIPVNNTNYGGTTISGFLENIFFPFISGTVSLDSFPIYTYGINTLVSSNFGGSITLNDNTITGIAFVSGSIILRGPGSRTVGGAYNSGSIPTILDISSEPIYRTRAYFQRGVESTIVESSPQRIRFEPLYFYGVSANASLGTGVSLLTPSIPSLYTYSFGSKPSSVTHTGFAPNNQYIYFAYPSPLATQDGIISWGNTLTSIFDTNANFEYISSYQQVFPVNITFTQTNKTLRYRIYRSSNLLTVLPGQSFTFRFTFGA